MYDKKLKCPNALGKSGYVLKANALTNPGRAGEQDSLCNYCWEHVSSIMKTCLSKYTENFTTKMKSSDKKKSDIFHISAQNKDCGYSTGRF